MKETVKTDKKFMILNKIYKDNKVSPKNSRERKINCPKCGYSNYVKYTSDEFTCTFCKATVMMNILVPDNGEVENGK